MGYSQSDLATDGDAVLACPQFIGIGAGGAVSLDSITCPANTSARGKVTIMTLFGDGTTDQAYIWTRISGEYCWQDTDTMEKADGITFQPGQAVWVQCDAEDTIPFTSSGAVAQEDIDFELGTDGDAVICGNATPVNVDIQDILCPANTSARGKVTIMTLFGDGTTDQAYIWTRISGEYCWQDTDTMEKAESITFAPGKGLWVQCDAEDTITMTIPGVEL